MPQLTQTPVNPDQQYIDKTGQWLVSPGSTTLSVTNGWPENRLPRFAKRRWNVRHWQREDSTALCSHGYNRLSFARFARLQRLIASKFPALVNTATLREQLGKRPEPFDIPACRERQDAENSILEGLIAQAIETEPKPQPAAPRGLDRPQVNTSRSTMNLVDDRTFEADGGLTIGIGAKNCLYTLRIEWNDTIGIQCGDKKESMPVRRSCHLRNLGKDWAEVAQRLPEILIEMGREGEALYVPGHANGILDPNRAPDPKFIPTDTIPFGAHEGKTIGEVREKDPRYLFWLAENYHAAEERPRGRWLAYLRDRLAPELEARKLAREAEAARRKEMEVVNREHFKPITDLLQANSRREGDFCSGIAKELAQGSHINDLSPRAAAIVRDIWAKQTGGRRGSKLYDKAVEQFELRFVAFDPAKSMAQGACGANTADCVASAEENLRRARTLREAYPTSETAARLLTEANEGLAIANSRLLAIPLDRAKRFLVIEDSLPRLSEGTELADREPELLRADMWPKDDALGHALRELDFHRQFIFGELGFDRGEALLCTARDKLEDEALEAATNGQVAKATVHLFPLHGRPANAQKGQGSAARPETRLVCVTVACPIPDSFLEEDVRSKLQAQEVAEHLFAVSSSPPDRDRDRFRLCQPVGVGDAIEIQLPGGKPPLLAVCKESGWSILTEAPEIGKTIERLEVADDLIERHAVTDTLPIFFTNQWDRIGDPFVPASQRLDPPGLAGTARPKKTLTSEELLQRQPVPDGDLALDKLSPGLSGP